MCRGTFFMYFLQYANCYVVIMNFLNPFAALGRLIGSSKHIRLYSASSFALVAS